MPPHWKTKDEDGGKVWLPGRIGSAKASLELLKYRDKVDNTKNQLLFHVDSAKGRLYLAQTGLTPAAYFRAQATR